MNETEAMAYLAEIIDAARAYPGAADGAGGNRERKRTNE